MPKLAVTAAPASALTVQTRPETESHPLQPVNDDPGSGSAVNSSELPAPNCAEHVPGQSIPAGLEETAPDPAPARLTLTGSVKCAVAVLFASRATVQTSPDTESQPLQWSNPFSGSGVGVRSTSVSGRYEAVQVSPQSIPAGSDSTVPSPPARR